MIYSENNKQLSIVIENEFEWLEIFDNGATDVINIHVSPDNIDFFFPNRKKYLNDKDVEQKLIADADRFDTIELIVAEDVMDRRGEGVFEVKGFGFGLIQDPDEDKFVIPSEEQDFAVLAYEISPDKLEP